MLKTIEIHDHPINYVEAGDPDRPAVVLLTGWAQDHRLFKTMVPELARDFHVLSPDWRGHDPAHTLKGDFDNDDLVADTLAFLEATGVRDNFNTVSHSHGCWVNTELASRLGSKELDRIVLIDWLVEPHPGFAAQVHEGRDPAKYEAARKSMFDEWAAATTNEDVLNHIYKEMPSFGGEMWMRANREIETAYARWGSPLKRMSAIADKPQIKHIFSQPTGPAYRQIQSEFAAKNPWFHPHYLAGKTHFPSLENGPAVAAIVKDFLLGQ